MRDAAVYQAKHLALLYWLATSVAIGQLKILNLNWKVQSMELIGKTLKSKRGQHCEVVLQYSIAY